MFFFYIFFLVGFSLLLLMANVICFKTKRYLYLFVNCMLFLPEFYAIEINSTLPLITVRRVMFVVFYVYTYINRRNNIDIRDIKNKHYPKEMYLICGYFIFRCIANLYYVLTFGQAIKTLLVIICEQLALLVAFYMLAPTKKEIKSLIKTVVWTASVIFFMGIVESYTNVRLFDALYTIHRYVLNDHYIRLGLLRATATMGLPGKYGNMCVLVFPLILYMYEVERKKRYLVIACLCLFAIIHSGSRADLLYLGPILFVYLIFVLHGKERREIFFKNAIEVITASIILIAILSIANPYYKYYYMGTAKAVLNEVGFDFDLNEGAPDSNTKYGENADSGSYSRTKQLTAIQYVAKNRPIFGFGSGAQTRDDLRQYEKGKWVPLKTYDMGILEIICDEGLIGSIGLLLLLFYLAIGAMENRYIIILLLAYVLTTLSTANMYNFLFLFVILTIERQKIFSFSDAHCLSR